MDGPTLDLVTRGSFIVGLVVGILVGIVIQAIADDVQVTEKWRMLWNGFR